MAQVPREPLPLPALDATLELWRAARALLYGGLPTEVPPVDRAALEDAQRQLNECPDAGEWMSERWLRLAYLAPRAPLMLGTSFWAVVRCDLAGDRTAALRTVVCNALKLHRQLPGDPLWGGVRIPRPDVDAIEHHVAATHWVLGWRGYFWRCRGIPSTSQLDTVTTSDVPHADVGCLTALSRDTWAARRAELEQTDAATLDAIETALFVVCLDESPSGKRSFLEKSAAAATGEPGNRGNRWYDKGLQLFVDGDGGVSCCVEHSALEGVESLAMVRRMVQRVPAEELAAAADEDAAVLEPLPWSRPTWPAEAAAVEARAKTLSERHLEWDGVGTRCLAERGISPDALLQLAAQLTYARLHGLDDTPVAVYESVATGHFIGGRTETGRPATPEARDFVRHPTLETLRTAAAAHDAMLVRVGGGGGFDRHVMCLNDVAGRELLEEERDWVLSTSHVGDPLVMLSYAPAMLDGYGVIYNFQPGAVRVIVTTDARSTLTDADAFVRTLQDTMAELRDLLPIETRRTRRQCLSGEVGDAVVAAVTRYAEESRGLAR
jgi:hypothetical protein